MSCQSSDRNKRRLPGASEEAGCVRQAFALGPRKGERKGPETRVLCVQDSILSLTCLASSPGDIIMCDHRQMTFFLSALLSLPPKWELKYPCLVTDIF